MQSPNQWFCTTWGTGNPKIASYHLNPACGFANKRTKHIKNNHLVTAEPPFLVKTIDCVHKTRWDKQTVLLQYLTILTNVRFYQPFTMRAHGRNMGGMVYRSRYILQVFNHFVVTYTQKWQYFHCRSHLLSQSFLAMLILCTIHGNLATFRAMFDPVCTAHVQKLRDGNLLSPDQNSNTTIQFQIS